VPQPQRRCIAKLTAQAVGKAIDVSAFELSSGKFIPIKPETDETMRNVVYGPDCVVRMAHDRAWSWGADAAHNDHFYVDVALHRTSDRYRVCQ
jgi:hypothetical protein